MSNPEIRTKLANIHKNRQFQLVYPRYILGRAEIHLNELLIPAIKSKMRAKDYSQKIIDSTRIEKIDINMNLGIITYDTVCDFVTVSNFDISTAREETGTIRHFIKPILKKALHYIARGVEIFSKGHWVKGIIASHIIANTMKELEPELEKILSNDGDILYEKTIGMNL